MMAVLGVVVILFLSQDAVSRILSYIADNGFVKLIFLVKHEADVNRLLVEALPQFGGE